MKWRRTHRHSLTQATIINAHHEHNVTFFSLWSWEWRGRGVHWFFGISGCTTTHHFQSLIPFQFSTTDIQVSLSLIIVLLLFVLVIFTGLQESNCWYFECASSFLGYLYSFIQFFPCLCLLFCCFFCYAAQPFPTFI